LKGGRDGAELSGLREIVSYGEEETKSDAIWISVVSTSGPTDVSSRQLQYSDLRDCERDSGLLHITTHCVTSFARSPSMPMATCVVHPIHQNRHFSLFSTPFLSPLQPTLLSSMFSAWRKSPKKSGKPSWWSITLQGTTLLTSTSRVNRRDDDAN
jgi:hypothetical protein